MLNEVMPGIYVTDSLVRGEAGKKYTLTIETGGTNYSASDVMPLPVEFNENDIILKPDKTVFGNIQNGFTIEFPLVTYGATVPIKTELAVLDSCPNTLYAKTSFYFFPGIDAEGLVPKIAQLKFAAGDTVIQKKVALPEMQYQFLRAVVLETEYYGGVLSSVPANVPTNVSNDAVGFFAASSVTRRKFSIE